VTSFGTGQVESQLNGCSGVRPLGGNVPMRLLVLGGTRFVGRVMVFAAMKAGWEVTTFNRGQSGLRSRAHGSSTVTRTNPGGPLCSQVTWRVTGCCPPLISRATPLACADAARRSVAADPGPRRHGKPRGEFTFQPSRRRRTFPSHSPTSLAPVFARSLVTGQTPRAASRRSPTLSSTTRSPRWVGPHQPSVLHLATRHV
jgi:hypothetical protein